MKADVKAKNMVSGILTLHCLNQINQKLLWSINSANIVIYFRDIWASSAEWVMVTIIDCSYTMLFTSLETRCLKWQKCLEPILHWVIALLQGLGLLNVMGKNRSFGVVFVVSSLNTCSEWIWCMETLITYHMYLFWHVLIIYVTWVAKWHHSTFYL